ncbi:MAG: acyltransferase [Prevotella sp.]|jgi:acetyltransferase-like isoleucine patch superfamily enzyme|nr:acyltransferase [Prevotella sp.]
MKLLKKIIQKLQKFYYTSSSERLVNYYRKKGIRIGGDCFFIDPKHVTIDTTRPELVEIGEHVFIHKGTIILTHDWASWGFVYSHNEFLPSHGKVKIGNNVWMGENVTILKGVTIGDNVIIGIGSIVTKDIPSNSIAVGVPAKVTGSYDDYYEKRKKLYVDECFEYARAILDSGGKLTEDKFYDDYPCFVDGKNYKEYDYPYSRIFNQEQFEQWKESHKALFNGFDDFVSHVKE